MLEGRAGTTAAATARCRPHSTLLLVARRRRAAAGAMPQQRTAAQAPPAAMHVTAQDVFDAAAANMVASSSGDSAAVGLGGRWERWQPPPAAHASSSASGVVRLDDPACGWVLASSGQSVYAFEPDTQQPGCALLAHVLEVPDAAPTPISAAAAAAGSGAGPAVGAAGGAAAGAAAGVVRATNSFSVGDVFFQPHLPSLEASSANPAASLRLFAANAHGFAMAPVLLPPALLAAAHGGGGAEGAAAEGGGSAAGGQAQMPFIVNLYIKHPSPLPGVGRRWGWNVQYQPTGSGRLQHMHHTSLGRIAVSDRAAQMQPGLHAAPLADRQAAGAAPIEDFVSAAAAAAAAPSDAAGRLCGSAVEFRYDADGALTRRDEPHCSWQGSAAAAGLAHESQHGSSSVDEVWFSSGSWVRAPRALAPLLATRRPLVLEAGAVYSVDATMQLARWLFSYSAVSGRLEAARLEVYPVAGVSCSGSVTGST